MRCSEEPSDHHAFSPALRKEAIDDLQRFKAPLGELFKPLLDFVAATSFKLRRVELSQLAEQIGVRQCLSKNKIEERRLIGFLNAHAQ